MSLKRSLITVCTTLSIRSVIRPTGVEFSASSRAALSQTISTEAEVVSGSVMTATRGSVNSLNRIFSFGLGLTAAGMSAKIDFIFPSTASTSMSPTTMTA